jgi:nucleoside-diphosphate-sugar epimerase
VAKRLLARGARVTATTREPARLQDLGLEAITVEQLPAHLRRGMHVVHSIPPEGSAGLLERLGDAPSRVVYLSSTAVYGEAREVNETTPVDGSSPRASARLAEEGRVAAGPWSWLVLRPAAIYGPGRGVHESYLRGAYVPSDNFVSRIHVEDLAAHVEAALFAQLSGAWPVADDEPCTSREIAEFCAAQLGGATPRQMGTGRRPTGNRRVDGSAIRRALGIELKYPSYRVGIPAMMQLERGRR